MDKNLQKQAREKTRGRFLRKRWQKVVAVLAGIVVFGTTYALILPAITMEDEHFCGLEEHLEHTDECYELVRTQICPFEEREAHVHTEECYGEEKTLTCTLPEGEGHTHGEACYAEEQVLTCTLAEDAGHTHTESCYADQSVLLCLQKEGPGHVHSAACMEERRELTCGLAESEEHTHTDACYTTLMVNVCGEEEYPAHTHGESCYGIEKVLVCGDTERAAHTHGEGCYTTEKVLVCTEPEYEAHTHTDACYSMERTLICGEEETTHVHDESCTTIMNVLICGNTDSEHTHDVSCYANRPVMTCGVENGVHVHTEACFSEEKTLVCGKEIHEHTLQCFSDPEADVETATVWERTLEKAELNGNWSEDVLAIADTQLGYTVSQNNYKVLDDGSTIKGYTRYGAWYGDPYGDWCAMFASFCIRYAGVSEEYMPIEAGCQRWIEALQDEDYELYFTKEQGEPREGDLIFFDYNPFENEENRVADHVGIIKEIKRNEKTGEIEKLFTIEGNHSIAVATFDYNWDDRDIMGFASIPENPHPGMISGGGRTITTIESAPASDGAVAVITGVLPQGAEAVIEAVPLTMDEMIAYFGEEMAASMGSYVAYDIKIMVNGEEWQPDATVSVTVREPGLAVEEGENLGVAHVNDETAEISDVAAGMDEEGEIVFDTDGFSLYIFYTFTVDFHYGETTFSINGRTSILLSELFEELGIERSAADVQELTFTDPTLVTVEKVEGDWKLTSLKAFSSYEMLTCVFGEDDVLEIPVTDAAQTKWEKITSASQLTYGSDSKYMLVFTDPYNNSGDRAVTDKKQGGNMGATKVTLTKSGDYYTTTDAVSTMMWTFTKGSDNSVTIESVGNPGWYIWLGNGNPDSSIAPSNPALTLTYSDGFWTVSRTLWESNTNVPYYLKADTNYNATAFTIKSWSHDNLGNFSLYRQVEDTPAPTPTYWQRVTSLSDITDTDEYLIVRDQDGVNAALKFNTNSKSSAMTSPATFTDAGSGVWSTTAVDDSNVFKFTKSGDNYVIRPKNGSSYFLNLGSSNMYNTGTAKQIKLTSQTEYSKTYWQIQRTSDNNYLRYNEGFTAGTGTDGSYMTIYKKVDQTAYTYWQKVTSLEYGSGKNYLIVYRNGSNDMAAKSTLSATAESGNVAAQQVVFVEENGVYKTATEITENMLWWFNGSSNSALVPTNHKNGRYLWVGNGLLDSKVAPSNPLDTLSYYNNNGKWYVSRKTNNNTYYMYYDTNGGFFGTNTTSFSNAGFDIYEQVSKPSTYETTMSGSGDSTKYTINVYTVKVDGDNKVIGEPEALDPKEITSTNNYNNKFTDVAGLFPDSMAADNTLVGVYYGEKSNFEVDDTVSGKTVADFYRRGNSYSYALGVDYSDSTSEDVTASNQRAIFLVYTENSTPGGGGGGEGGTKPSYPAYVTPSGAKTGTTLQGTVIGTYYSDPATSQLESRFTDTADDDGKVLTDKSVVYGKDDYGAFSTYAPNTFGVTLSALAQSFVVQADKQVAPPLDVVFILDASGSMINTTNNGVTSANIMVESLNYMMDYVLSQNEDNRVGVVAFSGSSKELLSLGHYQTTHETTGTNKHKQYFAEGIYTANNVELKPYGDLTLAEGGTYTSGTFNAGWYGTYTQSGIARGYNLFNAKRNDISVTREVEVEVDGRTFTTQYTAMRRPVVILISDGEPTYCTNSYQNVLNGTVYGDGSTGLYTNTKTGEQFLTDYASNNNKGIIGYYTILSAQYYKNQIGSIYHTTPYFHTVGIGMYSGGDNSLASSAVGDDYKRAVLNPTSGNISHLNSCTPETNSIGLDISGFKSYSCGMLYNLLNNTYTDQGTATVTIAKHSNNSQAQGYGLAGNTSTDVPTIKNPYKNSGYSYADGSDILSTVSTDLLTGVFKTALANIDKISVYGFILVKDTNVEITDDIGEGMHVLSAPVLNYGGTNYTSTANRSITGGTEYSYTGTYTDPYTKKSVDLSKIKAQVVEENGVQTVKLIVPADEMPTYMPSLNNDNSVNWYFESLPVRLIYQVGLTDEAKIVVNHLAGTGQSKTFYTNRFGSEGKTVATIQPTSTNPYYKDNTYSKDPTVKTENTTFTKTNAHEFDSASTAKLVKEVQGNNGKLVFTSTGHEDLPDDKAPDHYKRIDALRDGYLNPDTDLDTSGRDLTDLYRLYLDVGPESAYNALDIMFIIDSSTSMCGASSKGGFDAYDILGNLSWRCWALDTLLNGEPSKPNVPGKDINYRTNNAAQHQPILYANGLIYKIAALNPNNKIAVARFSGESSNTDVLLDWTQSSTILGKTLGTDKGIVYSNVSGTNYVLGLQEAHSFLQDSRVVNDENRKVLIFLSDGLPTRYYGKIVDGVKVGDLDSSGYYGTGSETDEEFYASLTVIDQFKSRYANQIANGELSIYSIGVGDWKMDLLDTLSTVGAAKASSNFQEISNDLDNKITRGVGRYTKLVVEDKLSENVDFFTEDLDLVVQKLPKGQGTGGEVWYTGSIRNGQLDGSVTTAGQGKLDPDNPVTLNLSTKTVTVRYAPDYEEEGGYTYSLSFNVKATQKAYDKFAANRASQKDGYTVNGETQTGDANTDYLYSTDASGKIVANETSSLKPGFFSNDEATLYYTQTHAGKKPEDKSEPFDDPVIQVSDTSYTVTKKWNDEDKVNHSIDQITVKLFMSGKDGDGRTFSDKIMGTVVLSDANEWTHTFTHLPKGYSLAPEDSDGHRGYVYRAVEDPVELTVTKNGQQEIIKYVPVYKDETQTDGTTLRTITNYVSEVDIEIVKVDEAGKVIPYADVLFVIREKPEEGAEEEYVPGTSTAFPASWLFAKTDETGHAVIMTQAINGEPAKPAKLTVGKTYQIMEINAPPGFNALIGWHDFKVSADGIDRLELNDPMLGTDENHPEYLKVTNTSGYELPETGGRGTDLFTYGGLALVLTAWMIGIGMRRRRKGGHIA